MILRFREDTHTYVDVSTGAILPSITQMLERAGEIDSTWYTEESSIRGTAVHKLTADYDLDALDPVACDSAYKGWLLGYVELMTLKNPRWVPEILEVEYMRAHPDGWAGTPDRVLKVCGALGVLELKSGARDDAHELQTAMQTILVARHYRLRPEHLVRYAVYLEENGRYKLLEHKNRADYGKAREIIQRWK